MSFLQGLKEFQKQNHSLAQKYFDQSIKQNDHPLDAIFYKGLTQYYTHRYQSSKQTFQELLKLDPTSAKAQTQLGAIETALGNYEDALQHLKISLLYNDDYWQTYYHRGYTYWRIQKYDLASFQFEKAISSSSFNNPKMYIGRAAVTSKIENSNNFQKDIEYAKKSLKEKQYRDLFPSEVSLLSLCLEQYDIWSQKLSVENDEKKVKTIYENILQRLFKVVYLNNGELWKNSILKIDEEIEAVQTGLNGVSKCECNCQLI